MVWHHTADLLNYEIVEICTAQYIDVLVSTNGQLLTPPEEWLIYLMPHRTRLFFPLPQSLKDTKSLAQTIYERAFTRLRRKQANSHLLQHESIKSSANLASEEIHSE